MEVVGAVVVPEELVSATNGVSGHYLQLAAVVAGRAASGGGDLLPRAPPTCTVPAGRVRDTLSSGSTVMSAIWMPSSTVRALVVRPVRELQNQTCMPVCQG
jgi:hypothetical protein